MKKEHAERNEQLNDKLIAENIYKDWIVTTAFYSAIHYAEYRIFSASRIFFGKTVRNLEEAHFAIPYQNRKSRHETRGALVKIYLYNVQVQYDFLRKQSQTARYIDYRVSQSLATQAKGCLNKIKEESLKS